MGIRPVQRRQEPTVFTSATRQPVPRRASALRKAIAGSAALVVVGAALAACSGAIGANSAPAMNADVSTTLPAPAAKESASAKGSGVGITVSPAAPLIVRSGNLALRLKPGSVTQIFDKVSGQADALGGFVSSSATTGRTMASLVLRVPSNDFSKLVDEVSGDGMTLSEQLNGQDVSGESINLRARITNLTAEESSLRTLIGRAGSIASILDVQDQLFNVEGEIEELTAQESSLIDQATFATLDVSLQTAAAVAPRPTHPNAIGRAVSLAGRNTVAVVRGIVLALGWAFPAAVAVLLAGGVFGLRRRRRAGVAASQLGEIDSA